MTNPQLRAAILERLAELYWQGKLVGLSEEVQMLGLRAAQSMPRRKREQMVKQFAVAEPVR